MLVRVTFQSEDWKYLVSQLTTHLQNARDALENKVTNAEDTVFYRGRIALAKELLKLPEIHTILPLKGK